jgi:pSer/pThr/pTyr-binding forkhead associated (FHA) protein
MADLTVEVVEGAEAGRQLTLSEPLEIGRQEDLGLSVDDDQVSRLHARISPSEGGAVVEDLGSTNGTYVNGHPVHGHRHLLPGDRVRMGLTVLELRSTEQVAARASAVGVMPEVTKLGDEVLNPATQAELDPAAVAESAQAPPAEAAPAEPAPAAPPPAADAPAPAMRVEEQEPAFVPRALSPGEEHSPEYERVSALLDSRVKHRTTIAAFALLAIAALAVLIYFGAR